MSIVQGYYNVDSETFLGPIHTESGHTGRYVEGNCWGEFNTETGEFKPLTNPMIRDLKKDSGMGEGVIVFDENPETGKTSISGMSEDDGSEYKSKLIIPVTRKVENFAGKSLEERTAEIKREQLMDVKVSEPAPVREQSEKPKLDLDNLF